MQGARIIQSFLVPLGLRDNLTPQLTRSLRNANRNVAGFAKGVARASSVMGGLLVAANTGMARFALGLVRTNDTIRNMADEMGKTTQEATLTHHAVRAMGMSLSEIEANPYLLKQFNRLKEDAANIQLPDMSRGIE